MSKRRTTAKQEVAKSLEVTLDQVSIAVLQQAAQLRGVSVRDYVRLVIVAHAKKEVESPNSQANALAPHEQLAFWEALQTPAKLTAAGRRLGAMMRGDA